MQNIFLTLPRPCDRGLIHVTVYYFQIRKKKNKTLLLVELVVVTFVPYIVRHPIFIIIILSSHERGYPRPSLATSPYRSPHPAGPRGCTPCLQRAAVCMFEPVALLLLVHVKRSIGVHHL